MTRLRLYLLGTPLIELDGAAVDVKRRKDLALTAYLAVTRQEHTREALATLFWPERDSSRAFSNLRRSIWELKQIFGEDLLAVEGDTVALKQGPQIWSDVEEFRSKITVQQVPDSSPVDLKALAETVELYQGDFMSGFTLPDCPEFDDWQYFNRDELRRDFGSALEKLAADFGGSGDFEHAIYYAQHWLALDNLNEAPHRMLMTLYAWSGERAAAIRQFQECERILEEELGLTPEEDTIRLLKRIQSGEVGKKHPSEEILFTPVSNLPIPPTPFVGRRRELDELHEYLNDPSCRLMTLLGPGGAGKTRLAIQVAEESLDKFTNGACFVALAGLENPQAILPAVAEALNFPISAKGETPKDQIFNYLRQKHLLLVLDNFEHLVDGAVLIGEMISHSKGLKILATSRERLGLQGETIYEVSGMGFPEEAELLEDVIESYSALQLFAQSADRVQAGYQMTLENLPPVVRIAQLVRGMPLALELAAAWLPILSPREIADEIERGLDFLETSMKDVPERQRSMRAVFDHSWRLLSERERESFAKLSVFRGGFTLQAMREIFRISPLELREMVGKSLLSRTPAGRYELHELLRQYAAEKLAQYHQIDEQAHDQHSAYFCQMMLEWKQSIIEPPRQPEVLDEISLNIDNILAAWNWALEHQQVDRLEQVVESLALFYWRRVRVVEGITFISRTRQALEDRSTLEAHHLYARSLAWEGTFQRYLRNFDIAERHFQEALAILEGPEINPATSLEDRALAHLGLGHNAFQLGDAERSQTHFEISLELYREAGNQYFEAEALQYLAGVIAYLIWDAERAEEYLKTALEINKSLGDHSGVAGILYERAVIAVYHLGDIDKGIALFQESRDNFMQVGDQASVALGTRCAAQIAHLSAHYIEALDLWQSQLPIFEELGMRNDIAWTYTNMGLTQKSLGNYAQAEAHIREALKILATNPEEDIQIGINRWSLGCILIVQRRLPEATATFEASLKIDRQMTGKHNLGRDLASLSLTEYLLGEKESAWIHVLEAIKLFLQYQHYDWMVYAVSTLALLLADRGEVEEALTLYGLVTLYPEAATSQWFEDVYWCHVHESAKDLPQEIVEEVVVRGREQDFWEYMRTTLRGLNSRGA